MAGAGVSPALSALIKIYSLLGLLILVLFYILLSCMLLFTDVSTVD